MPTRVSTITSCFRGERYLQGFLDSVLRQTIFDEVQVVLVHNEPTETELSILHRFRDRYPDHLKHIIVTRETIGSSWNRAIKNADAEYVAIWNVDDLRTPDSLEREVDILDRYPDVALTYGDIVVVRSLGSKEGELIETPEFQRSAFMRACIGGCFQMFRKSVCQRVGLFDEQFRSGADFDLWVRIAANTDMRRTTGLLGYYLDAGLGLSTDRSGPQPTERTVVELRYGIYDKIDYRYMKAAMAYRTGEILFDNTWHPVSQFVPNYRDFLTDREPLRAVGRRNYRRAEVRRGIVRLKQSGKAILRNALMHLGLYERVLAAFHRGRL